MSRKKRLRVKNEDKFRFRQWLCWALSWVVETKQKLFMTHVMSIQQRAFTLHRRKTAKAFIYDDVVDVAEKGTIWKLHSNYYVEFAVAWITGDCISYGNYKVEAYLFFPRVTLLTPNITDNISPSTSHSHQSLFKFMPCQKLIYDKHLRHEFVYIDITLLLPSI